MDSYSRSGINLIKSVENTLYELIQVGVRVPDTYIDQFEKFNKEDLDALEPSELATLLLNYQNEVRESFDNYKRKINSVTDILHRITWSNNFENTELDLPNEDDMFYDLFRAVNILQRDVVTISSEISQTNSHLESMVEQRTREIKKTASNMRALLENYKNPIFLLDKKYTLIDYNHAFEKLIEVAYGVTLNQGNYFFEPFDEILVNTWRARFEKCLKGETIDYAEHYTIKEEDYYYNIRVFPIKNEDKIYGIGVFANDVTDLNKSKMTLEEQNLSLMKLNNELDSFIYRSSHDLRAPVSSLLGLINLARMVDDPEEKDNCLSLMEKSVNKMENFIKDIIDHTKNSKLELEPSEIQMDEFINDIIGEFEHLDPTKEIKFDINLSGDCSFVTDRFRLITVLNNIISNAIKYKSEDREPQVELLVSVEKGMAEITISDNGQGIRKEYLGKIFDMFFRANEDSKGTGLGLYIVKDIVEKLGGTIDIESEYGKGTTLQLKIPELKTVEHELET